MLILQTLEKISGVKPDASGVSVSSGPEMLGNDQALQSVEASSDVSEKSRARAVHCVSVVGVPQ